MFRIRDSYRRVLYPLLLLIALWPADLYAQVYPNSPVFRDYRPADRQRSGSGEGLRKQINVFLLERDAASGDPLAQHELAVRLLTGNGLPADTARSAYWMRRSAEGMLVPAMYNYALLLYNGWGTAWNPFEAYRLFRTAADRGMTEAQYVTGIFFTDNLVLQQNWDSAWTWISLAAQAGYQPALRARTEIANRGHVQLSPDSMLATPAEGKQSSDEREEEASFATWTPVLLDFQRKTQVETLSTSLLLDELLATRVSSPGDTLLLQTLLDRQPAPDALQLLRQMAAWANPEAMVLLGRLHEEGRVEGKSDGSTAVVLAELDGQLAAAELYISAVFLEAVRAPALLTELLRDGNLTMYLRQAAWAGNARAQFIWSGLKALGIETQLTEAQALDVLKRAAAADHTNALVHLGMCYAQGRWVEVDHGRAWEFWRQAAEAGNAEARLRLAATAVLWSGSKSRASATMPMSVPAALEILGEGIEWGSLFAEVAIASSYERGIGRSANLGMAVRSYRDCAVRGSQTAWLALLRLHDARRPADPLFNTGIR
ncbi:MAG: sel1 repeat family protein [Bacteroidetes bacterium]|nr:sel1 repeat family protein [Bacteroidota bacterium]